MWPILQTLREKIELFSKKKKKGHNLAEKGEKKKKTLHKEF